MQRFWPIICVRIAVFFLPILHLSVLFLVHLVHIAHNSHGKIYWSASLPVIYCTRRLCIAYKVNPATPSPASILYPKIILRHMFYSTRILFLSSSLSSLHVMSMPLHLPFQSSNLPHCVDHALLPVLHLTPSRSIFTRFFFPSSMSSVFLLL